MGNCCLNQKEVNVEIMLTEENYIKDIREKIYKQFRLNPFHNYGTRRQKEFIQEYIDKDKEVMNSLSKMNSDIEINYSQNYPLTFNAFILKNCKKRFDEYERKMIIFTKEILGEQMDIFKEPEIIFMNVLMFVLSNTKNNYDEKYEFVDNMIQNSFLDNSNINIGSNILPSDKKIDLDKSRQIIKTLVNIIINTFINFVILPVYEDKSNIVQIIGNEKVNGQDGYKLQNKYDRESLPDFVFVNLFKELKINYHFKTTFNKYLESRQKILIEPLTFAGYNSDKNIGQYNLELKNEILHRLISMLNADTIIDSLINFRE